MGLNLGWYWWAGLVAFWWGCDHWARSVQCGLNTRLTLSSISSAWAHYDTPVLSMHTLCAHTSATKEEACVGLLFTSQASLYVCSGVGEALFFFMLFWVCETNNCSVSWNTFSRLLISHLERCMLTPFKPVSQCWLHWLTPSSNPWPPERPTVTFSHYTICPCAHNNWGLIVRFYLSLGHHDNQS